MISLAKEIRSEKECLFVLSGMLVFADKIIDAETSRQVKEWIRMTKVGRLYEQEKIEYANKQRENDIIYLGREDGKSEEEIVSRLKKMLGYDDSEARAAISVFDSRQAKSSRCHSFSEQLRKYGDAETFQHGSGRLKQKNGSIRTAVFPLPDSFIPNRRLLFLFSRNKTPGHPDPEILSCNLSFSLSSFT